MIKDMTKGSPVRLLLGFAVPMLLGSIFQQLYSVVDAMVLGRGVGVQALAAAGSGGSLHFFIFGFVTGLAHGYSIMIAQSFGAGDHAGVRRTVANSGYVGFLSAAVIMALSLLFSRPLMELLQTPADIFEDALLYIRITFIGLFATVFYNVLGSALRALGDSLSPLVIVILSSVLNVGLDVLFVMVFHWGVAGAAWATVLAQLCSGFMCLFVLARLKIMRYQKGEGRPDGRLMMQLLRLGLPVGLMNSITAIGVMILQTVVNGLGSAVVAAYTAGMKIVGLAEQPGCTVGLSLGTYVGQNLGAGDLRRVRTGVRKAIGISLVINLSIGSVLVLFGKELVSIFVSGTAQSVIETAYPLIAFSGALEWVLGLLFVYRFSLQSLGDTLTPMISGALELLMRVAVVLVLTHVFSMGFLAVCIAEVAAWGAAALLLCATYYIRIHRMTKKKGAFPAVPEKREG